MSNRNRQPQDIFICVDENGKIEAMSFKRRDNVVIVNGEIEPEPEPIEEEIEED